MAVNIFVLLATGLAVGFVSGMFGIGGGFLMTPLLMFLGVSPGVAVTSVASHVTASSFSGALKPGGIPQRNAVARQRPGRRLRGRSQAVPKWRNGWGNCGVFHGCQSWHRGFGGQRGRKPQPDLWDDGHLGGFVYRMARLDCIST